ncbi:MAG: small multi-drug export protein [Peptoniphilaceae bacterium]|uniref:COG2426 family protein n=1 Tax=Parvimonas sp. TaxID=1944660 RepID=UPI0025D04AE9|nr:small multi-drug export protein [Parvimonas sp.]MCI5997539.1 small multi-drug export protein [Parvimonas sp.]MDD7765517.1 small multi-drug export protein [Peptoniphilaceae bacterium]MDY3051058.1 small multi-drug export protein [Parvimonas sp.]
MQKYILVFLISMLPIIELRGAIPYAHAMGLSLLPAYLVSVIGNLIPVPFIYFFIMKILNWGKDKKIIGKFCKLIIVKGHNAGQKILNKAGKRGFFLALVLFIGIPFPGTGAYTGILAASILDIDFKTSILAAICGVILAAILTATLSTGIFNLLG